MNKVLNAKQVRRAVRGLRIIVNDTPDRLVFGWVGERTADRDNRLLVCWRLAFAPFACDAMVEEQVWAVPADRLTTKDTDRLLAYVAAYRAGAKDAMGAGVELGRWSVRGANGKLVTVVARNTREAYANGRIALLKKQALLNGCLDAVVVESVEMVENAAV